MYVRTTSTMQVVNYWILITSYTCSPNRIQSCCTLWVEHKIYIIRWSTEETCFPISLPNKLLVENYVIYFMADEIHFEVNQILWFSIHIRYICGVYIRIISKIEGEWIFFGGAGVILLLCIVVPKIVIL